MPKLISHEPLASNLFNTNHSGAVGQLASWDGHMTNSQESVLLMVKRMRCDYEGVAVKMRKPFGSKEIETYMNTILF